jgi:hypothetical protein
MDNDLCLSEWIWLHIVLDVIMDDGSILIIVVVVVVPKEPDWLDHMPDRRNIKFIKDSS